MMSFHILSPGTPRSSPHKSRVPPGGMVIGTKFANDNKVMKEKHLLFFLCCIHSLITLPIFLPRRTRHEQQIACYTLSFDFHCNLRIFESM